MEHSLDNNDAAKVFARIDDLDADKKRFMRGLKDRLMRWLESVLHFKENPENKLEM
jgi:hypothetical protein